MYYEVLNYPMGFPGSTGVNNPPANAGDARSVDSVPGSGRSPGIGNGNLLQYSCLESFMYRGAWRAIVHGVAESDMTEHTHTHTDYLIHQNLSVLRLYDFS